MHTALRPYQTILPNPLPQRLHVADHPQTPKPDGVSGITLILSTNNQTSDRIEGLRAGADDYPGKPFDFTELLRPQIPGAPLQKTLRGSASISAESRSPLLLA